MEKIKVRIKKQVRNSSKWYYASDMSKKPLEWWQTGDSSGNTMSEKEVFVWANHGNADFAESYRYSDSLYISIDDCETSPGI